MLYILAFHNSNDGAFFLVSKLTQFYFTHLTIDKNHNRQ
jgi:hypothetical protein